MINIIYLLPYEKGTAGGITTSLNQSININKYLKNTKSEVIFIKKRKISKFKESLKKKLFSTTLKKGWSTNDIEPVIDKKYQNIKNILIKKDFNFNKNSDFIILPEIFAHFASEILLKKKIKYGIFVQNGNAINFTSNLKSLDICYKKAKNIFTISNTVNEIVKISFPFCKTKIFKLNQSVNTNKFYPSKKKQNLITYMPRKLSHHADFLIYLLRKKITKNWKIKPLINLDQNKIASNLSKSKIFLSFSHMEGFGLPPLEAAIAGNKVIGYDGISGKEYWKKPIFTKIEYGDFKKFVKEILVNINKSSNTKKFNIIRKKLSKKYSHINDKKEIKRLNKRINSFF